MECSCSSFVVFPSSSEHKIVVEDLPRVFYHHWYCIRKRILHLLRCYYRLRILETILRFVSTMETSMEAVTVRIDVDE